MDRNFRGRILQKAHIQLLLVLTAAFFALNFQYTDPRPRPLSWAVPIISDNLENCFKLDDKVYRSAQPDEEGFSDAVKLGITSVLNLRSFHSDDDEAEGLPLKLYRVKMDAGSITEDEIIQALRIIKESNGPVLVHCAHGSDRTGAVCAMYRIVFQNRSKQDAIDELINGGYGFHTIYGNIPKLIESSDIDKIKNRIFIP